MPGHDVTLERDLDPFGGWVEEGEAALVHADRPVAEEGVQVSILEPEELAEVVAPRRPLVGRGGRENPAGVFGLEAEILVHGPHRVPVRPPVGHSSSQPGRRRSRSHRCRWRSKRGRQCCRELDAVGDPPIIWHLLCMS